MESPVKLKRKGQSIWTLSNEEANPISEFTEIINKEVPTACFIETPTSITKAGTIRNPPPAPIKPVMIPTRSPCEARSV